MNRIRIILILSAAAVAIACGGGDEPDKGPADVGAGVLPNTVACTQGQTQPCSCVGGGSGTASCQIDGTFSVCQCQGGAAPPAAGGPPMVAAGAAAPPTMPMAGGAAPDMPMAGAGEPMAGEPEPIIVSPEDIAACNPMGQPPTPEEDVQVLKVRTSDAVAGGFAAPGGTYYGCFWAEYDMPEKAHIVGWEGAIEGDRAVHHQQVSTSPKPFYLTQQGGLCGLPSVEFTWTGERPPEWTPSMAGYPIGGPENGGKARFLWQTHFESATNYVGGFNVYYTHKLRKYDAGNYEQGDVRGILIPAMQSATHVATCSPEDTTKKLTHPIYVWSAMLHAHLTIQNIKSEVFRNGQMIQSLGEEQALGFGFFDQRFKPIAPCFEMLPGDEIKTTCQYNNAFPFDVTGGEATNQEMCTVFMTYFPRLPDPGASFCGTIDATGGFGQ